MNWKTIVGAFEHIAFTGWARLTAPFRRKSIAVAVANQPRLLRDMLCRLIDNEPDFRVVTVTGDPAKLWRLLKQAWVDWVVMTTTDVLPDLTLPNMRFRNRKLAFLALSRDAQSATVTILAAHGQLRRQVFVNLTPDQLFAILRRQVG